MKFPKEIYVTWQEPEVDTRFLSVETTLFKAADPDGEITMVGVYRLALIKKLKRVVQDM